MTVVLETTKQRWNGASIDEKPTDAPEGSEYHAVDTGEKYIFHNGMWVEDLRDIYAIKAAAI